MTGYLLRTLSLANGRDTAYDRSKEQSEAEHTLLMEFYTKIRKNFVPDNLLK